MENAPTTIKDKLPEHYVLPSQPLFYCEEDDSLHLSRQDASRRYHRCLVEREEKNIISARLLLRNTWDEIQQLKSHTLPYRQKLLDFNKARLKELLSSKGWRETHPTHAAKRREILELRYNRMCMIGEYNEYKQKLKEARETIRRAREAITAANERCEVEKQKAKEAEEFWKTHPEENRA